MDCDTLEERYVLLWEAVSDITTQIKNLSNHYYQASKELGDKDLINALAVNSQSLGLARALEIIENNLRIRGLLP